MLLTLCGYKVRTSAPLNPFVLNLQNDLNEKRIVHKKLPQKSF